jgi:HEAT repeat protein
LENLKRSFAKLTDSDKDIVLEGIKEIEIHLPKLKDKKYKEALDSLVSLFYIDTFEKPDLQVVIDRAFEVYKKFKTKTVPFLLSYIRESDIKFQLNIARALGKIGKSAIDPILSKLNKSRDPAEKSFLLYSLGKIKDPAVTKAIPSILRGLKDRNVEVRDSATRTFGKIFEVIPSPKISLKNKNLIFENLKKMLSDESSGVRSKAIRSLGKMSRYGYLDKERKEEVRKIAHRILGLDESYNWDIAYIVRREAQEVYEFLSGKRK